jgi:hypothetical protein
MIFYRIQNKSTELNEIISLQIYKVNFRVKLVHCTIIVFHFEITLNEINVIIVQPVMVENKYQIAAVKY